MIGTVFLAAGLALLLLGGVGLLRFRGPYERLQAAGVGDIGGAFLFLVGLILRLGWPATGGILVALIGFFLFTGPLSTHAIAKAAFVRGERPSED
ncbi:MAG: hypothetical protein BIP78_0344 [Candidatus Bipolaricaulis sibiricus]|uniref:Na(+) H(+) antiporter subunit G n=1 Tax=Bipolaricaulis sibiricus TaxID=2501609 RepID=A0A410FT57_BIPS1|nr:MAG: hypothetical protein BIP78_0344 [Candidatus Bipolaricaulis sibiricus]